MRKQFREYYTPTAEEFSALWADATFAFDANVLLDIYRFSPSTTNQLFSILEALGDRVWIPYQAALEYQKNRHTVSSVVLDGYDKASTKIDALLKDLEEALQKNAESDAFLAGVRTSFEAAKRKLAAARSKHAKLVPFGKLDDRLARVLADKVGSSYSMQELAAHYQRAEARFKDRVPPGYKDTSKPGVERYGDVLVWFQILDYAKLAKKPVILITGDQKEDWWWQERGKTIGPRPELRREALEIADIDFFMYTTVRFLENARDYLGSEVTDDAIAEAKDVQSQPQALQSLLGAIPTYEGSLKNLGFPDISRSASSDALQTLGAGIGQGGSKADALRSLGLSLGQNSIATDALRNLGVSIGQSAIATDALRNLGVIGQSAIATDALRNLQVSIGQSAIATDALRNVGIGANAMATGALRNLGIGTNALTSDALRDLGISIGQSPIQVGGVHGFGPHVGSGLLGQLYPQAESKTRDAPAANAEADGASIQDPDEAD